MLYLYRKSPLCIENRDDTKTICTNRDRRAYNVTILDDSNFLTFIKVHLFFIKYWRFYYNYFLFASHNFLFRHSPSLSSTLIDLVLVIMSLFQSVGSKINFFLELIEAETALLITRCSLFARMVNVLLVLASTINAKRFEENYLIFFVKTYQFRWLYSFLK